MGGPKIAFRIGPLSVAWYGIILVSSALVAAYVAQYEAKRRGEDIEHVWNAFLLCLFLGIVGARLYHVLSSLEDYLQNPLQIFNTRAGGLGIIGAVIGGAIGLWIYTRYAKISFLRWADIATPGLILAQAIGRWGNYVNQELYGHPTDLPWGIYIEPAYRLRGLENFERFHPTFLYESLWNLIGFIVLMVVARKLASWLIEGDLLLLYGLYYPLGRFFIEYQRPDAWQLEHWKFGPFVAAQWFSIASLVICGVLLIYRHRRTAHIRQVQQEPALAASQAPSAAGEELALQGPSEKQDTASDQDTSPEASAESDENA